MGQSMTLTHLAPFVDISRQKYRKMVREEFEQLGIEINEEKINEAAELRTKEEITRGVQTIQYQVITLMTTNGQAPFVTVFMYLNETKDPQTKADLALIIEEALKQRIQGVKNEKGVWVTPAFPKLIYVLQEDNVKPGSKYYYLTELAARCSAKRLVPDYISEKVMLQEKGATYPAMGCVAGEETITYMLNNEIYTESFERAWLRLSKYFEIKVQDNNKDHYIQTKNMKIWDCKENKFVDCYGMIRNSSDKWIHFKFNHGRQILCTEDHPFSTVDGRVVLAKDLTSQDKILRDMTNPYKNIEGINVKSDYAWLLGFLLCDGCYDHQVTASIAAIGEDDIEERFKKAIKNVYGLETDTVLRERGQKGTYKDLKVRSGLIPLKTLESEFLGLFGGCAKTSRKIPEMVFRWSEQSQLDFYAGMIDADGYINKISHRVEIGSTNKELGLLQYELAKNLGFNPAIYLNEYTAGKYRYKVEFYPDKKLVDALSCQKKKDNFEANHQTVKYDTVSYETKKLLTIKEKFSYDITTESEHFAVSGIYSHNCRSFLTPDRTRDMGNVAKAENYSDEQKYYGRLTA